MSFDQLQLINVFQNLNCKSAKSDLDLDEIQRNSMKLKVDPS
jgi:hypothetical protein